MLGLSFGGLEPESRAIVRLPRVFFALVAFFLSAIAHADIGIGDSIDDVIRQHGSPTSRAKLGTREIFMYPHGGRVEFIDGKVADVKGTLPVVTPAPTSPSPATSAGAEPAKPAPAAATPTNKAAQPKPLPKTTEPSPAGGAEALAKHIEKMDTAWGERPAVPQHEDKISWPKLLVSIVLHFGITLLALRIAFKVEEMDALWSGTLAIAAIDLGVYTALELLGPVTSGISSGGSIEGAVGALVMVVTVQKFCFTKKLSYAIATALVVKLVVQLCHIFLFVLLLNVLFG